MLLVASVVFLRGFMGAILSRKIVPTLEKWRYHFASIRQHGRWSDDQDDQPPRSRLNAGNDDGNTIVAKTVMNSTSDSPVLSDSPTVMQDGLRGYGTDFETLANTLIDFVIGAAPMQLQPYNQNDEPDYEEEEEDDDRSVFVEDQSELFNALSQVISSENDFQTAISSKRSTATSRPSLLDEINMATTASHLAMSSKFSAYTAETHHSFFDDYAPELSATSNVSQFLLDEIASAAGDITPLASVSQFESANNSIALDENMREKADATDAARLLSMLSAREVSLAH